MGILRYITFFLFFTIISSYARNDNYSEIRLLQKLELLALKRGSIGKTYFYDIANRKDCNKSAIKYLGIIKTKNGKQFKVLSSFFVFNAAATCHGSSSIKFYNLQNKYIGQYHLSMPYDLPTYIFENKFIYWTNSKECISRKGFFLNLKNGLPSKFFLPCTVKGGDLYYFSTE